MSETEPDESRAPWRHAFTDLHPRVREGLTVRSRRGLLKAGLAGMAGISDLEERGLLDEVLVIAMGEFGRTPTLGTQGSTDGRNHWPVVSSVMLAGGGFRHGQVIGETEWDGGDVKERPVTPFDLAATIYHHFGIPLDTTYADFTGRPNFMVMNGGRPISELV